MLLALLGVGGCSLLTNPDTRCSAAHRETFSYPRVLDPTGKLLATSSVGVSEVDGDSVAGHFFARVGEAENSVPLMGHVLSVTLLDATGQRYFDVPLDKQPYVAAVSNLALRDSAFVPDVRTRIQSVGLVLQIHTDLPGLEDLRTPLPPPAQDRLIPEYCSTLRRGAPAG